MRGMVQALRALGIAAGLGMEAGGAAPDGPGLPNLVYTAAEVGKPLSLVKNREGHGWAAMHRGHLVVMFSRDGGLGDGAISFLDIGDPRSPRVVSLRDDSVTRELREPHGWGMRGDIACLQANYGMQFWDFSDVAAPRQTSYLRLPGITISDYDQGLWWTSWQGGHAYGGGSGNGIYVVDARDPAKPAFVKRVPVSAAGGFRVGPVFAVGNLLVVSSTDAAGISTFDIGDPANPRLLATRGGAVSYASMFNGGRLYLAGSLENDGRLLVFDLSNPARIDSVGVSTPALGDKGGYVGIADGYAFAGFSTKGFAKFDLSKPGFPRVASGTTDLAGRDEDFATPLGNLVFVANDHPGQGSGLIPHQAGRDTAGPRVNFVSPRDGATGQPLTSRVGLTFTDAVDGAGLTAENLTIRPVGGEPLEGWYVTQSGIVNFTPKAALQPETQYEVVVREGGLEDYAGNPVPEAFRSVFTTAKRSGTGTRRSGGPSAGRAAPRGPALQVGAAPGVAQDAEPVDARGRTVP